MSSRERQRNMRQHQRRVNGLIRLVVATHLTIGPASLSECEGR